MHTAAPTYPCHLQDVEQDGPSPSIMDIPPPNSAHADAEHFDAAAAMADLCLEDVGRRERHARIHQIRATRLAHGTYGTIHPPILLTTGPTLHTFPSYLAAHMTATHIRATEPPIGLDLRCFFTGVVCPHPATLEQTHARPLDAPWTGSRDHLVPLRRQVPGVPSMPMAPGRIPLVWTSQIVNMTLGLAPLLVRLKIRQWLMTARYTPMDTSVEAGRNMRWLLIDMLNSFRIHGRYPWSRTPTGGWWFPDISQPYMQHMWTTEANFLRLSAEERSDFIEQFYWNF